MRPLSPALLIAAVQVADRITRVNGRRGQTHHDSRSTVAFIDHVGYYSHLTPDSTHSFWPLPRGLCPDDLAKWAVLNGVLTGTPAVGDVFLRACNSRIGFESAGIMIDTGTPVLVKGAHEMLRCTVAAEPGSRRTDDVIRAMLLSPDRGDRFIRWVDLDSRRILDSPAVAGTCTQHAVMLSRAA